MAIGALIRYTSGGQATFQGTDIGTGFNNYQGYAVASGRFLTTDRQGTTCTNTNISYNSNFIVTIIILLL